MFFHMDQQMNEPRTQNAHTRRSCVFAVPCYEVERTHIEIKLTLVFCSFEFEHSENIFSILFYSFSFIGNNDLVLTTFMVCLSESILA